MKHLSEVVVRAIQYLNDRTDEDYTEDDDLKIIEDAAATLIGATEEEREMLKRTAVELGLPDWPDQMGIE